MASKLDEITAKNTEANLEQNEKTTQELRDLNKKIDETISMDKRASLAALEASRENAHWMKSLLDSLRDMKNSIMSSISDSLQLKDSDGNFLDSSTKDS